MGMIYTYSKAYPGLDGLDYGFQEGELFMGYFR